MKKAKKFRRGAMGKHAFYVVVSYVDESVDVIGDDSYAKCRAIVEELSPEWGKLMEGLVSVEMADREGRLLYSSEVYECHFPVHQVLEHTPGKYRWDVVSERLVAEGTGPALGPVKTAIAAACG